MSTPPFERPAPTSSSELAGVDGCRAGWVVATDSAVVVIDRLDHFRSVSTVGIDMPIGLPEKGPRTCDRQARAFLGPRRSSVFATPARACLHAEDYATALLLARAATGTGLSLQAFHLLPKIRELDGLVDAAVPDRFVEVHPECAFALLNDCEPLASKRSVPGEVRRCELLSRQFGPLPGTPRGARLHDVLDALAVLWSTHRFAAGVHRTFGDGEVDGRGLPMRIVC